MFKGIHYGEEVWMDYVNEGESALKQVVDALNKANLEFELLPIYHKSDIYHENLLIDVLKYRNNGEDKYYIISGLKGCYLVTRRLPDDMDLPKLIYDLLGQKKGKAPMVINSKFKSLFDKNMLEAQDIISEANGIFDKNEKYVITIFRAKAEDAMSDKDKKVDEWLFSDENPVEEHTMFLYLYKVIADLLQKKGYSYADMEYYAQLDHHDVDTWENDLKYLYDGFYWRITLNQYEEEAKRYLS